MVPSSRGMVFGDVKMTPFECKKVACISRLNIHSSHLIDDVCQASVASMFENDQTLKEVGNSFDHKFICFHSC